MPRPVRKLEQIPEILYESPEYPGQKTSPIPFMAIPKDKDMPIGLFILEYRKTGEYQIGSDGKPEEIEEGPFPHTYIEMDYLFEVLEEQFPELDMSLAMRKVRTGLGMKPTKEDSRKAGEQLLSKVEEKTQVLANKAKETQEERMKAIGDKIKAATPPPEKN
jgi:hypothetical protein